MSRQDSMFMFRQVLVVTCWGWVGRARLRSGRAGVAGARPPGLALRGGGSGRAVAVVAGCAEQAGERVDCFEEQRVDAGLLVGGAAGAECGDRPAVPVLGGELADPGGQGGVHQGRPGAIWPEPAGGRRAAGLLHGQSRVCSATAFLAQASSTRSLPAAAAAMSAAAAAVLRALGSPLETRCSRAMASSASSGSPRPASFRWCRR